MKQKLLFFAFTLISAMLFSQAQNMAFEDFKTNDGTQNFFYKNIVKTDASGNIYTLGATTTSNSTTDILLTKKNSSGVSLWSKQINGTANYHDFGSGLAITSSGDVYITGAITNNTTTLAPELIIRKYNSSGSQQFSTTYSGAGYGCVGKDIVVDGSGNSYITGAEYNSGFNADILTIAFGSTGTQIWTDLFDNNSLNDGGVKIGFRSNKVTVTGAVTQSTNNYKIATLTFTASTGVRSETITLGSTMTSSVEIVTGMTTDASGNTYICGATEVSGQGFNMYVAKLTSSLTIAWQQTYNGVSNLDDQAKGIQVDGSGNVYITGYSTSSTLGKEIRTIKYNSSGTLQWNNVINSTGNNPDQAFDMEMDASSNIYVCGSISSDINQLDYYTVKYNSGGTKIWDIQTDGNHLNDQATNLAIDGLNNIIVTGESETSTGSYVYSTCKYIQKDIITPTDFNGETPAVNFMYYPNKGQLINTSATLIPDVKYYTNNTYPQFYFKNNSQSFVFSRIDTIASTNDTLHRIDLKFNNVVESSKTYSMEKQDMGYLNYYLGHLDSNGVTKVFGNRRLITPNIYANIDLMCSSNQNGIKYYFIVKPGGDMRDIQMEFTGATSFSLNGGTNALSINSSIGSLTFDRPIAYQLTAGNATLAVTSFTPNWTTNGASNKYKFNDGAYTSSLTLIIEVDQGNYSIPPVAGATMCWSTYFGGPLYENSFAIAKDNIGNQYIAGQTMSASPLFPITPTAYQSTLFGEVGGFYSKFDASNALWYSTYYAGCGAGSYTCFHDIKCKSNNEVVIAGYTTCNSSTMIKALSGAYNNSTYPGGSAAGFIVRFDGNGQRIWASYLGGATSKIFAIDFDSNGNLYVGGFTSSTSFPLTSTPNYNQSFGGGSMDAYLLKLTSAYALSWSTYIGGNSYDKINTIKVDNSNRILFFGYTESSNFPTYATGVAYIDNALGGTRDNFIGVFSSNAQRLWTSYLGGTSDEMTPEQGLNNVVYDNNSIFAVGSTQSSNFPLLNPGGLALYDNTLSTNSFPQLGIGDGYVVEFDMTTFQQKWGTLVSGNGSSSFKAVDIDVNGNLFIAGNTGDHSIQLTPGTGAYNQSTYYGGATISTPDCNEDAILLNFKTATRNLVWSTLIGGYNDHPYGEEIADLMIVNSGIYVTGYTSARNNSGFGFYPLMDQGNSNYFDNSYNGSFQDAFITKFCYINIVGVNEIEGKINNQLIVYPNPATNKLMINIDSQNFISNLMVIIYSSNGQEVFNAEYKSNVSNIEINTAAYAEGIYLIKVYNNDKSYTAKFIKQ